MPGSSELGDGKEGSMARIKAMEKNHIHTSSSRYIAYLR